MKLYDRKIQISTWYGWMGRAVSILLWDKLEIIVGTKWHDYDFFAEAGWASLTFAYVSIEWDYHKPLVIG